jgi:hypothetical protein
MTEEEIQKASAILAKLPRDWSREENSFLYTLIKKGHRDSLKTLRTEVLLSQ